MIWAGENETLKKSGVVPSGTLSSVAEKREFVLEMSGSGTKIVCNCVCLCTCVGAFLMQYCVEGGLVERLDGAAEAGWGGLAAGFSRSSRSGHCSQGSQALIVHCQCAHSAFFHCFFRKKTKQDPLVAGFYACF